MTLWDTCALPMTFALLFLNKRFQHLAILLVTCFRLWLGWDRTSKQQGLFWLFHHQFVMCCFTSFLTHWIHGAFCIYIYIHTVSPHCIYYLLIGPIKINHPTSQFTNLPTVYLYHMNHWLVKFTRGGDFQANFLEFSPQGNSIQFLTEGYEGFKSPNFVGYKLYTALKTLKNDWLETSPHFSIGKNTSSNEMVGFPASHLSFRGTVSP